MKRIVFYVAALFFTLGVQAQKDTVIYFNENKIYLENSDGEFKIKVVNPKTDTSESLLFEGTYGEDYSSESNFNFGFSKFLQRNNEGGAECNIDNKRKNVIIVPGSGPGFEFSTLSTRSLKKMGSVENAVLTSGYGFNMRLLGVNLYPKKAPKISIRTGVGMKLNWYMSDNNTAFKTVDGITQQIGSFQSKSWLYTFHLTVPAMVKWDLIRNKCGSSIYSLNAGMELGFKVGSSSKIVYRENGEKIKQKLEKGLNVNPVSLDLKLGVGISDMEFYVKYGLISLFKKDKGPDVIQAGWGMVFKF